MATWIVGGITLALLLIAAKHTITNFSGGKCSGCPGGCHGCGSKEGGGSCSCSSHKTHPQAPAAR